MENKKNLISVEEERARKIWKYYNWTRVVILVILIVGLYLLCSLN